MDDHQRSDSQNGGDSPDSEPKDHPLILDPQGHEYPQPTAAPDSKSKKIKAYFAHLTENRPDRLVELIFSGAIVFFSLVTLIVTVLNNASNSRATEQLLTAAYRIEDAADSFSRSSADISRGMTDAVSKLGEQAQASRDFSGLTKKQFATDQRPYLWDEDAGPESRKGNSNVRVPPDGPEVNASKLAADLWVMNFGKSPAINVHSWGYISTRAVSPETDIHWDGFSQKGNGGIYPPGTDFMVSARTPDKVDQNFLRIPRDQFQTIFVIHVLLTYSDLSGNDYRSEICLAVQQNRHGKTCNAQQKLK